MNTNKKITPRLSINIILLVFFLFSSAVVFGQDTSAIKSLTAGNVVIIKDTRIDLLGKKMAEYNARQAFNKSKTGRGYRLMILSTSNREEAIKVRTYLLQQFPDQQVYMTFINPFIKLKFGDFADKKEAENVRSQLEKSSVIKGNIYLVPEIVKLKGDKTLLDD